jgi:hypothetical protein
MIQTTNTSRSQDGGLGLFSDSDLGNYGDDEGNSLLVLLSDDPFYQYRTNATTLRRLSGTLAWFRQVPLQLLSKLPCLEGISIHSDADSHPNNAESLLSHVSFPSLRRLSLTMLHPHDTSNTLSIKLIVSNLAALELCLNTYSLGEETRSTTTARTMPRENRGHSLRNLSYLRSLHTRRH